MLTLNLLLGEFILPVELCGMVVTAWEGEGAGNESLVPEKFHVTEHIHV